MSPCCPFSTKLVIWNTAIFCNTVFCGNYFTEIMLIAVKRCFRIFRICKWTKVSEIFSRQTSLSKTGCIRTSAYTGKYKYHVVYCKAMWPWHAKQEVKLDFCQLFHFKSPWMGLLFSELLHFYRNRCICQTTTFLIMSLIYFKISLKLTFRVKCVQNWPLRPVRFVRDYRFLSVHLQTSRNDYFFAIG